MPKNRNIPLVATPNDLEKWLIGYRLSKYPDDEPGVWSTHGRISYHSPEHGSITFVVKAPEPGKLLIVSTEYKQSDQAQIYVENLLNGIINQFGDLSLPNGFSLVVSDEEIAKLLEERWEESLKTQKAGAYLATAILLGGILEGMLLDVVQSHREKIYRCKATPSYTEKKTGKTKTKKLSEWGLENFIDVSRECGWLENSTKYDAKIVREYRNLVHPNKQKESGLYPNNSMCKIARSMVEAVLEDLKNYAKDGKKPRS